MNQLSLVPIVLGASFALSAIVVVILCILSDFVKADLAEANGEEEGAK